MASFFPRPYTNLIIDPLLGRMNELLDEHDEWIFDTETTGLDVIGPHAKHRAKYYGFMPVDTDLVVIFTPDSWMLAEQFMTDPRLRRLVAHNALFDYHSSGLAYFAETGSWVPQMFCTMAAIYHGSTTMRKSLDMMARIFNHNKIATPKLIEQGKIMLVDPEEVCQYLADDLTVTARTYEVVRGRYTGVALAQCTDLIPTLAAMQRRGVRLLEEPLQELKNLLQRRLVDQIIELQALGFNGNINAPAQVGAWLVSRGCILPFTEKSVARGKPQVQTSKLLLERLAWDGSIEAEILLETRKTAKLIQAFAQSLPTFVKENGLLYPQITHAHTKTGRFSYSDPNLQQIPKRSAEGLKLRECITTPSGRCLVADFSQVEMRVAAGLSGETALLEAFEKGGDIHTEVAARALNKSPADITEEERFGAKAINFGILNGMGARRLSHALRSSSYEAQKWLDSYKRGFPKLTAWMERTWSDADVYRVARTCSGRTRVFTQDESIRSAVSVIVQGTAADLMRMALIHVESQGLRPVLSVHDEVVCDAPAEKLGALIEAMRYGANQAFPQHFKGVVDFPADGYAAATWRKQK